MSQMTAICNCHDTCLGLGLVGVDSHFATTEDELASVLINLSVTGIKILAISEELAATATFKKFETANPQILTAKM